MSGPLRRVSVRDAPDTPKMIRLPLGGFLKKPNGRMGVAEESEAQG